MSISGDSHLQMSVSENGQPQKMGTATRVGELETGESGKTFASYSVKMQMPDGTERSYKVRVGFNDAKLREHVQKAGSDGADLASVVDKIVDSMDAASIAKLSGYQITAKLDDPEHTKVKLKGGEQRTLGELAGSEDPDLAALGSSASKVVKAFEQSNIGQLIKSSSEKSPPKPLPKPPEKKTENLTTKVRFEEMDPSGQNIEDLGPISTLPEEKGSKTPLRVSFEEIDSDPSSTSMHLLSRDSPTQTQPSRRKSSIGELRKTLTSGSTEQAQKAAETMVRIENLKGMLVRFDGTVSANPNQLELASKTKLDSKQYREIVEAIMELESHNVTEISWTAEVPKAKAEPDSDKTEKENIKVTRSTKEILQKVITKKNGRKAIAKNTSLFNSFRNDTLDSVKKYSPEIAMALEKMPITSEKQKKAFLQSAVKARELAANYDSVVRNFEIKEEDKSKPDTSSVSISTTPPSALQTKNILKEIFATEVSYVKGLYSLTEKTWGVDGKAMNIFERMEHEGLISSYESSILQAHLDTCLEQSMLTLCELSGIPYPKNSDLQSTLKSAEEAFKRLPPEDQLKNCIHAFRKERQKEIISEISCMAIKHKQVIQIMENTLKKKEAQPLMGDFTQRPTNMGKDIGAFLITPIQRGPRYQLFMKELVKHSPEGSEALKLLQGELSAIEESIGRLNSYIPK